MISASTSRSASKSTSISISIHVCIYIYIHTSVYVCMYVCMYVCIHIHALTPTAGQEPSSASPAWTVAPAALIGPPAAATDWPALGCGGPGLPFRALIGAPR